MSSIVATEKSPACVAPLLLKGKPALSRFRAESLLARVNAAAPGLGVHEIRVSYVYLLECARDLSEDALDRCFALLEAVDIMRRIPAGFVVVPRKGTISPWCSKATDIFRNCGLAQVRRVERGTLFQMLSDNGRIITLEEARPILDLFRDRMTEGAYEDVSGIFAHLEPKPLVTIDVLGKGLEGLEQANTTMGLALSRDEMEYFYKACKAMGRNPTDAELVMFGQVNSEHCRHKIFKADWIIDGGRKDMSLFGMIQNTHKRHPRGTLVAYRDNAAVLKGFKIPFFEVEGAGPGAYGYSQEDMDIVVKVETHNHPTAISPYPGAATGVGGEIRDEAATGISSRSKAGLSGFAVSNLRVPGFVMPWEKDYAEFPRRLATPFQIMIEGPLGGARFGNEFGRPQLCGFFRTFEESHNGRYRGYHKPIMLAGGMGNIKRGHVKKLPIPEGAHIIQLGGPAMRIGLGGGAASSMTTGSNEEQLDFDSVQRDNAEVQRRCQGVIDACMAMKDRNPVCSIHDLGAGGLSNGCPELVSETGGEFWLRKVHNEEPSMSPMEIWCCEAQERYVLAVRPGGLKRFIAACERERCPVAIIGRATATGRLVLRDEHFGNNPIDIELGVILGKTPKILRDVRSVVESHEPLKFEGIRVRDAADRVLRLPAVAKKTFLVTIADRTVTGMTARDQMAGPYQEPISDVAVSLLSYTGFCGSAMAIGERTEIAVVSGPAAGRMAVGEALTNICAADVGAIGNVKLSANWMCACGEDGEDAALYDTVRAVGMEFCPALGVSIPVGKDSLSMRTVWETSAGKKEKVVAPLSLIVSAFAPVGDVRRTVTPDLKRMSASKLILLDLGRGKNRLGSSALARVYNQVGPDHPDADSPADLSAFFKAVQELVKKELLLAYHDRSDGGLFATLSEMAIGGRMGIRVSLDGLGDDPLGVAFNEELGAVLQVADGSMDEVDKVLKKHGADAFSRVIGAPSDDGRMTLVSGVGNDYREVYNEKISVLNKSWSELTYRMQSLRDNPECAAEEYDGILDENDPGMTFALTFRPDDPVSVRSRRPRVAILREQGVNGHIEMAAAFDAAGFESVDVHMTDLLSGGADLSDFAGLVACGGFSYGDVLGAGSGWAKSILYNNRLKKMFKEFFSRKKTFSLGVCNGCQMMSQLKGIIPGADHWPEFSRNKSEQFEARYVTVEIIRSPSIFFSGMDGSRMPIPVAHGEGMADFTRSGSLDDLSREGLVSVRYVDNRGKATERYPFNPNGSADGATGFTTVDGRVTIMMPHPERAFRRVQLSFWPSGTAGEAGPWLRMFQNARDFIG